MKVILLMGKSMEMVSSHGPMAAAIKVASIIISTMVKVNKNGLMNLFIISRFKCSKYSTSCIA